jgi:hypothetical protein
MYVGLVSNGSINGWGMKVDRGDIQFGVFENSVLKVNLTPLVSIFWDKIMEDFRDLNRNAINVLKKGEIFIGVPQGIIKGKFGFHFLENGEVYLGICDYDHSDRTGKFLHFDLDYNITKGEYKDGELIEEIEDDEYVSACEVWVNHEYMDFDIDMNYNPESFLLGKHKLMGIFEMGRTPEYLLVKANIYLVFPDRLECPEEENEDTTWFAFPVERDDIYDELEEIIEEAEHPWAPDFSDYRVDFINNLEESGSDHLIVYKHISCWNEDADFELDIFDSTDSSEFGISDDYFNVDKDEEDYFGSKALSLIPNYSMKKVQLANQWKNNGWYYTYPSVRDYVASLAEDDDVENFFGWLFDDARFNYTTLWSLPQNYKEAYRQFLELFPDLD